MTSPSDDTIKTTYTINIEKQASLIIQEEKGIFNNRQLGIVIIVSIVVIILFISIIIAITKNRRKKKGFGYDEEDEDDNDSLEMNFINNEEGEDVEDYNEVESPYPNKIITNKQSKEETEELKQEEKNIAFKENKKEDELSSKTNYQEEEEKDNFTKSKWDNFVDGYEEEENKKGKKRNTGRRFM